LNSSIISPVMLAIIAIVLIGSPNIPNS